jgi:hypothetical protein
MTSKNQSNESPTQLSTAESPTFDYVALDAETRTVVEQHTNEIKTLIRRNAQNIIDIGQRLLEVKEQLGHGHFRYWLKAEFGWSITTATRFMQVAEQFKCTNLAHLDIAASALYELASPSTPDAARAEAIELASQGKIITYSKAKAIVQQYKQVPETPQAFTLNLEAETVEEEFLTETETPASISCPPTANPAPTDYLSGKKADINHSDTHSLSLNMPEENLSITSDQADNISVDTTLLNYAKCLNTQQTGRVLKVFKSYFGVEIFNQLVVELLLSQNQVPHLLQQCLIAMDEHNCESIALDRLSDSFLALLNQESGRLLSQRHYSKHFQSCHNRKRN